MVGNLSFHHNSVVFILDNPKQQPETSNAPERRYIDGRWFSFYPDGDRFVEYVENEWRPVNLEITNLEELKQKWKQTGSFTQSSSSCEVDAAKIRCVVNGVSMVWNPVGQV